MRLWIATLALVCAALAGLAPIAARAQSPAPNAQRAAFYADVRAKDDAAAVVVGRAYRAAHPHDDRFGLDFAYALLRTHRTAEAEAVLRNLAHASTPAVRIAARRQLAAQAPVVPVASSSGAAPSAVPTPSPFTNAYELLAGGDLHAARDAFIATLAKHPDDSAAWRQLSYIDFVLKDRPAQIDALQHYVALQPNDDRAKLELAYALLGQGDRKAANAALTALTNSPQPEVAAAARKQLAAGTGTAGPPARLDVFGYAENDSRFHDTFYGIDARYALAPTKIEPYLAFHFSDDAKASSLPATAILNDDVAILALGVRTKLSPITYAFAEGGEAQSLRTGGVETDLRVGVLLSTRLGQGGFHSQTQIDASAVHYSRYIDNIAYLNVAHDFYIGNKTVRGVVGVNAALDTSRAFYNNAAETFGGLQVRRGFATFRLVAVAGTYLGRGIDPPERFYTSIRPILLVGFSR
jgi:thioredoxin-like negative regulator of GroEL